MTDDERFEQFLRDAATDYQAPPADAPREEMWSAIRARRATATAPRLQPVRQAPRNWMWMGMAATLLVGVAVGRFAWHRDAAPAAPAVAVVPAVGQPSTPAQPELGAAVIVPPVAAMASRRRRDDGAPLADARSTTYSLVATRHLADVEALLTSYSASGSDTRSDTLLARWAKDLLSNTRLLLDSPAARDPVRARLLQDLEVILVQLVQRSPGGDADERSAVERTLNKTQLIPRLRSAVPASLQNGTD